MRGESTADEISGQVGSFRFAFGVALVTRTSILNHLIMKNDYQTYLEIGVRERNNFDLIQIENKIGVDPEPLAEIDYKLTSDEFFNSIEADRRFDLIFIDGLHLHEQVRKDIKNALEYLGPDGTIVMHDCNPPTEFHQRGNYQVDGAFPEWNGTVWKSWVEQRCTAPDLSMAVVDTDWGVGVIQRGSQNVYRANPATLNYQHLVTNRKAILNLISVEEFLRVY